MLHYFDLCLRAEETYKPLHCLYYTWLTTIDLIANSSVLKRDLGVPEFREEVFVSNAQELNTLGTLKNVHL